MATPNFPYYNYWTRDNTAKLYPPSPCHFTWKLPSRFSQTIHQSRDCSCSHKPYISHV